MGLEECTFKPKLVSGGAAELSRTVATEAPVNIRSIDKYLERMYAARANKEEKDKAFATGVGSGKAWKNEITIPKAPKLAEQKKAPEENLKALQRPITPKNLRSNYKIKRHEHYPTTESQKSFQSAPSKADEWVRKARGDPSVRIQLHEKMDF